MPLRLKKPPKRTTIQTAVAQIQADAPEHAGDYLDYALPTDDQGRYWPYDEFYYRVESGINPELAWQLLRAARAQQSSSLGLPLAGSPQGSLFLTATIQKAMSQVDRQATHSALELMTTRIGEARHMEYLFADLTEDEAISSSQLEGAATTTLVAKEILKKKRKARSMDERMIVSNFQMMRFAWQVREEPLTPALICQLHTEGVSGIDNAKYLPGTLRQTDDVVVEGPDGEVAYQPPASEGLPERLQQLCDWINSCHDDVEASHFIHPLIKAICLHFAIGFEHPFHDGNGRVARALFYWFMFKSGYGALRYIAVSTLLKQASSRYAKSYLYAETDELDLTYFVDYQCNVLMRAMREFRQAYEKAVTDVEDFNQFMVESGLVKQLSDKQMIVFQVAQAGYASEFTANNVKENLGCSYNTAASLLNGLVALQLFKKTKVGRVWVYRLNDKESIRQHWGAAG